MQQTRTYDDKPFLYVKEDNGRFRPVDWKNGTTVRLRFYASMFTLEEKPLVESDLAQPENAHLEWEWRR